MILRTSQVKSPPTPQGRVPRNSNADRGHPPHCLGLVPRIKPEIHQRGLEFKEDLWPVRTHRRAPIAQQGVDLVKQVNNHPPRFLFGINLNIQGP